MTSAGTRPRFESSMPFEAAQARTALVSTCAAEVEELDDRLLRPPTRWAFSKYGPMAFSNLSALVVLRSML